VLETCSLTGNKKVAIVIPAYRAEEHILDVIDGIPDYVSWIIIVDDYSPDHTADLVCKRMEDARIRLISHKINKGVGGATMTGYQDAIELGADIIVKMDSDGQMDPSYILPLITPIIYEKADYTKGNRFIHLRHLHEMPFIRRIGNIGLSFLNKLCSGYWTIFDPTNGYTAISNNMARMIDPGSIHPRYFFESSMLLELGLLRAVVQDVDIPARYRNEKSSLSEFDSFIKFPGLLLKGFIKRFFIQYLVRDFSAVTLFSLMGLSMVLFGFIFGLINWILSIKTEHPATTGTVMLAVLPFILGSQFLLQALVMDIQNVPKNNVS
jgi:dolichol-phosphate mannosyltransferase